MTLLLLVGCGGTANTLTTTTRIARDDEPPRQNLPYMPVRAIGEDCDDDDAETQALPPESPVRVTLHTATCQALAGQLVFARESAKAAFAAARRTRDDAAAHLAGGRVTALDARIPRVTFTPPVGPDIELESVEFDGRPVPLDLLAKKYSVDPGTHVVTAIARHRRSGTGLEMNVDILVREAELTAIPIVLREPTSTCLCISPADFYRP